MGKTVGKEYTYEFIGSELEVVGSTCEEYEGLKGKVVNETRNTMVIKEAGDEKTIPKDSTRFEVDFDGRVEVLDGKKLTCRPEDRIKKLG